MPPPHGKKMYHRVAHPEAAIKGLTATITDPEGAAAGDVAKIATEIATL